jgi:hypothetical protein
MSERDPVTYLQALSGLATAMLTTAGFVGLTYFLGVDEIWAGFLFLLYWGLGEGMKPENLPKAAVGASVGLGMASLLFLLPNAFGYLLGMTITLTVILVMVYLLILQRLQIAINMATMIFLTVGSIPHLQRHANFVHAAMSLAIGIVYFGGLALAANWVGNRQRIIPTAGAQ